MEWGLAFALQALLAAFILPIALALAAWRLPTRIQAVMFSGRRSASTGMSPFLLNRLPSLREERTNSRPPSSIERTPRSGSSQDVGIFDPSIRLLPSQERPQQPFGLRGTPRGNPAQKETEAALIEERRALDLLNRTARELSAHHDLKILLQALADVGVELTAADMGTVFYKGRAGGDQPFELQAISGLRRLPVEQSAGELRLAELPFAGEGALRCDDLTSDPELREHCARHLPGETNEIRSFLAVPLVLSSGALMGGVFFGHEQPARFTKRIAEVMAAIASHASMAIENASLLAAAHQEIESRKRTEEWLNASETRFRDFAEVGSDALWETDTEFRVTSYIGDPEATLGLPMSEIIGKTRWEIAMADLDAPEWQEHIDSHIQVRPFERFEFKVTNEKGETRWISSSGRPFHDASGKLCGFRGTATDITARKHAEAGLAQSARQQEAVAAISQLALQQASTEQLFQVAAELIAQTLSVEIVRILELSADERVLRLRGEFGQTANGANQMRAIPLAVCRPLHEALSFSGVVSFSRADLNLVPQQGGNSDGSGLAVAMGDKSDRIGVLAVCAAEPRNFDQSAINFLKSIAFVLAAVSDQRKAEAVLRLRDRALEALDQGIVITDAGRFDNPLIYVNPAFERITSFGKREALGKNIRFLQGPETSAEMVASIRTAIESEEGFRGTVLNYRKDGSRFWNDLTLSPVRDVNGATRHFVGVLTDVTERIELEAQLQQAQKMEAVGHLTGGVAHDFNNLLAVILGNSEILYEETENTELKEIARLVMETAERGADLTQRLLAFGRRQALRPEALQLGEVITSFSGVLRRTLGEQIVLEARSTEKHEALVDRSLFESAVLNLAVNARDAMPDGGTLLIETTDALLSSEEASTELAPGDYIKVTVRDTGIGMNAETLSRAFEPFYTTKDVGKGSGLGLPMVYGFAKQSRGHVAIDSAPGCGTAVHLFLPQAPVDERREAADDPETSNAPKGCERILLVEDEPEVRRFVSKQLSALGYSVTEAEDGRRALEKLGSDNAIDLLFTDLILPGGLSGLELLEEARRLYPHLRAILTTGYTEEFAHFENSVTEPVLKKPYRRQQLAAALRQALDAPLHRTADDPTCMPGCPDTAVAVNRSSTYAT
jgi:PAS domain S-box-containing protein